MSNEYEWYEMALKGVRGPIYEDSQHSGYYRSKNKDKTYSAWAYWRDTSTGEVRCHCDGRNVDPERAADQWKFCSKNPISAEMYWTKIETGEWPDVDTVSAEIAKGPDVDPQDDPVASMQAEIDKALSGVIAYQAIESDEQAARGQTLRSTLTTLSGKADKARTAEKEPHLEAGREVDARWQPIIKAAKSGADEIRKALSDWEDTKRAQATIASEAGTPSNAPAPSTQIRGGSGRAASVSTKPVVTAIDIDKAFAHFKADTALIEFLTRLAQKAVEAGITVEGAVVEQRSVVR